MATGDLIKQYRTEKGLSLQQMALKMQQTFPGYSRNRVWKSEKGLRDVPTVELRQYARVFGCKIEDLLDP